MALIFGQTRGQITWTRGLDWTEFSPELVAMDILPVNISLDPSFVLLL
jgi:hypothetical protein